jgi:hypothetical protein
MSIFSDQVPISNLAFDFLPMYHVCDGHDARRYILSNRVESLEDCDVFSEKLIYLFYGKPAFKYKTPDVSTKNLAFYPTCFIFRPESLDNIKRIFPFDTGALHLNMLKDFVHKSMGIEDFLLGSDLKRVADLVPNFFGGNDNYLAGKPKDLNIPALDLESSTYVEMVAASVHGTDERRATIEVQLGEIISEMSQKLIGIVCPSQFLDDKRFMDFVKKYNIRYRGYSIQNWIPSQHFGILSAEAQKLIEIMNLEKA